MNDSKAARELAAALIETLRKEQMGLELALKLIKRGEEMAAELQIPMVITVVDEGGNMVAMHRMDNSLLASISISYSKAYTAAALRSSTEEAAGTILPGESLYGLQQTHPGRFCIFGGGIPIMAKRRCIGGLGVSGGTVEQDIAVAKYAAQISIPEAENSLSGWSQ